jgi:hypothetical protein
MTQSLPPSKCCHNDMNRADVVRDLGKPITYYPNLAHIIGVRECVFLMQLLYWSTDGRGQDGWVYKTAAEWEGELAISERHQRTVRENLRKLGVIEERVARWEHTTFYRINLEIFNDLLEKAAVAARERECEKALKKSSDRNVPSHAQVSGGSDRNVPSRRHALVSGSDRNVSPYTESTTESTSEKTPNPKSFSSEKEKDFAISPGHIGAEQGKNFLFQARHDPYAAFFALIYKDSNTPVNSPILARLYVKRRQTILNDHAVQLLLRFLPTARYEGTTVPDWRRCTTFTELLQSGVLKRAIAACRDAAKERLAELDEILVGPDDEITEAEITAMTTAYEEMEQGECSLLELARHNWYILAVVYLAHFMGHPDLAKVQHECHEEIKDRLIKCPYWNAKVSEPLRVFGVNAAELYEAQGKEIQPLIKEKNELIELLK